MKTARYTAVEALVKVTDQKAYSNIALDQLLKQNELSPRDSAFANALFYGVIERMITIDHILAHYSSTRLNRLAPPVLEILRTGIYQLLYMNGVDDYAAVSESVNLTRQFDQPRASGLVNGILRSFLRDSKQIPKIEGSRIRRLGIEYSCLDWIIKLWIEQYGEPAAIQILSQSLGKPPLYIRCNTLRTDAQSLLAKLREEGVTCERDELMECCINISATSSISRLDSFKRGWFHVQDKASQLCAAAVAPEKGMRVLDVCAAPGGKSFTMAEIMGEGELVALDLHEVRVRLIQDGVRRLGFGAIIHAAVGDALIYQPELGEFDRILCDVPCSGLGIIRRKPEIKYKSQESIANLPEVQYKILKTSSQYLKQGGKLVYSTCTLCPTENERVVERFLEENKGFVLAEPMKTFIGEQDMDGFFTAIIHRI